MVLPPWMRIRGKNDPDPTREKNTDPTVKETGSELFQNREDLFQTGSELFQNRIRAFSKPDPSFFKTGSELFQNRIRAFLKPDPSFFKTGFELF